MFEVDNLFKKSVSSILGKDARQKMKCYLLRMELSLEDPSIGGVLPPGGNPDGSNV